MSAKTEFHQLTTYVFPPGFDVPDLERFSDLLDNVLFEPIDQPEFQELGFGLTNFGDFMSFGDDALDDSIRGNEYLAFGFRVDRRTAPAGAVERRHREKIAAWLKREEDAMPRQAALPGTGAAPRPVGDTPRLSKERRKELRDEAKRELICKAPPNPKHIPVVVDGPRQRVYVGTASAPVLRAFEAAMCKALSTFLIPLDPVQRLALAGLEPVEATFLPGLRFMTWLWRRIVNHQERDEPMELVSPVSHQPDQVRIRATGVILEQSQNGQTERLTANGRDAGTWEEIETAIRQGRSVVGLGLVMESFEDVYALETSHDSLALKQLKLPKLPKGDDVPEDDYAEFLLRMGQVRAATGYLDDLWTIWVSKMSADGKLQRRERHEGAVPVGYDRMLNLAEKHRSLFGHLIDKGVDSVSLTFMGKEHVIYEREDAEGREAAEEEEAVA